MLHYMMIIVIITIISIVIITGLRPGGPRQRDPGGEDDP